MPTMSFRVPAGLSGPVADDLLKSSVAGGHDRAPTPTRSDLADDLLVLERDLGESGPAYIPWPVPRAGHLMTPTTTLMFRDRPYRLVTELARGKLNQVRNQYADWHSGGLLPAPDVESLLEWATHRFGAAILDGDSPVADHAANESLALAHEAADLLVRRYEDQVYKLRKSRQPKLDSALGCRLGAVPARGIDDAFRLSFNSAVIPLTWRTIEPMESNYRWAETDAAINWAVERGLRVFAGPVIDFSAHGLPDYVLRLRGEPLSFKSLMSDFVETVVSRYRGKVSRWLITTGANGSDALGINEEDLIRLTAVASDAAWQIDANLQLVFGLSQPWGDYLSSGPFEYSPFVYADTLLRSGLPFAGIELEWYFGTSPRGSYCRDALNASQLLDLYGVLGVPVHVSLAYPSAGTTDAKADTDEEVAAAGRWRDFTPDAQADWAATFASLALCKSFVAGVYWDHLSDAETHRIPHAGLVDAGGAIKPAFDRLRQLRDEHLR
jgi:hypothetical protein